MSIDELLHVFDPYSYLFQRCRTPRGFVNPFSFGGGGSGLPRAERDRLAKIVDFDYMGAAEYDRLGVDCLLLSAWPVDAGFFRKAEVHAAINNYWLSLSVPAQVTHLMPAAGAIP